MHSYRLYSKSHGLAISCAIRVATGPMYLMVPYPGEVKP
jgi:hypothetical protein